MSPEQWIVLAKVVLFYLLFAMAGWYVARFDNTDFK